MRLRLFYLPLLACVLMAAPVSASVLFDSGPPAAHQAHLVSSGEWVTNLFRPTADGTARSIQLALWVSPGDSPGQLDWALGTIAHWANNNVWWGDDSLGHGTAVLQSTFLQSAAGSSWDIYTAMFTIPDAALTAGDPYTLTIYNALSFDGREMYWDENIGTSFAGAKGLGQIEPESFFF